MCWVYNGGSDDQKELHSSGEHRLRASKKIKQLQIMLNYVRVKQWSEIEKNGRNFL